MEKESYVTLATSDFYGYGCIVLGHSLRKSGTRRKLVALVTNDVSWNISQLLQSVFDCVERVPKLDLEYEFHGVSPDVSSSLAKLHCWRLTQFTKGVFLNADTLVLQNCDELFERSEFSAVPDVGWPDCFNSGVFVFEPSLETYWGLINLLKQKWHRDGGDQYVLNLYFNPDWKNDISKRLPFIYNLVCSSIYTYAPAFQQFGKQVKIAHFVGHPKPWDSVWNSQDCQITLPSEINHTFRLYHQTWLEIFKQEVFPHLSKFQMKAAHPDHQQVPLMHITSTQLSHNEGYGQMPSYSSYTSSYPFSTILKSESYENLPASPIPSMVTNRPAKSFPERPEHLVFSLQYKSILPAVEQMKPTPEKEVYTHLETIEPTTHFHEKSEHVSCDKLPISSKTTYDEASYSQSSPSEINGNDIQSKTAISYDTHSEMSYITQSSPEISHDTQSYSPEVIHDTQSAFVESSHYSSSSSKIITDDKEQEFVDEELRMKRWEEGDIDYLGSDTFDNIWKRLSSIIEQTPRETTLQNTEQKKTQIQMQLEPEAPIEKSKTDELTSDVIATLDNNATSEITSLEDEARSNTDVATSYQNKLPGYPLDDYTGMYEWEQGRIDYTGKDSSDNIIQRLDFLIKHKEYRELLEESIPVTPY